MIGAGGYPTGSLIGNTKRTRRPVPDATGKVYLVGSGPGGLAHMTVRAQDVIRGADVILYDQLPGDEILASLPETAERIDCGKFGGRHTREQEEIEALMVRRATEGKTVVRLKGGDPFVFGRGGEELEVLRKHRIPVELVPGVTSAIAVPGSVGIPLTHRKYASQVTILTGHEDPAKPESALDWELLARSRGTIVILMGVKNLPQIAASLLTNGKDPDTPVAIIERGMRPDRRVTTGPLSGIGKIAREEQVKPPAVIVIGGVVNLYDESAPDLIPFSSG
jgi:uroporphyrin-III C-methyltransferase